ncbi:MAG TPA: FAD-dependent monooxygenase [Acidisphaera sp.]|nr:FAD-dependent monooxygenase [Acidisphaera sp.]
MTTVVIGGGPAGSAASIHLARAGRRVTVLERESGPVHKVCGDFLSAEALRSLRACGVDPARLGAAPIDRVRLVSGRREAVAALPFAACGLTRRTLDAALLDAARDAGVDVRAGTHVRVLDDIEVADVLVATGKHALRGVARVGRPGPLVGFKTYLRLRAPQTEALRGNVELVLYAGGYAGLQLVEDDTATLCLLAKRSRLQSCGGFDGLIESLRWVSPHLDRRLDDAVPLLARPLAISGLAYGHVHAPRPDERFWRLGDQAAVIPSLTGDGVSIALHSGTLAARVLAAGGDARAYHTALRRTVRGQVARAHAMQRFLGTAIGRLSAVAACRAAPIVLRASARATRIDPAAERRLHAGQAF